MADTESAPPRQYKQKSRKGKKAWRKNVDVTDVQTGLEDVRGEIIQGGVIAEKPAEELFTLDTTGAEGVKKEYSNKHKQLKSEEIIALRSAVPAVDSRKRKSVEGIATGSSKRSKNGTYVPHKELQHLRQVADGAKSIDLAHVDTVSYDPWDVKPPPPDPRFSYLKEKKPKVEPVTIRRAPISLAASGKPFAAVRKPNAGKSYNPAFEDWESHVTREGEKELEAEKKRLREAREEAEQLEKALAEAAKPDPKSDDEYESAWESEWEGLSESEGANLNKKRPERKTPTERNKIKRRKEAEAKEKWQRQMKKRDAQQERIKELAKEVEKKERERKLRLASAAATEGQSEESDEDEVLRKRTLGKHAVPTAPLEVVLADELQDSLRALRPEGNLLKDRYRNLLLNGKIEARRHIPMHKKPKREVTEKWSYKDWKLR